MERRNNQQKVGIPEKRRGQQTGYAGNPDQNRAEMAKTPAISGRKKSNQIFGDKSADNVSGDAVTPKHNAPSTPAMTSGKKVGESGGEKLFKKRLAKKRSAER